VNTSVNGLFNSIPGWHTQIVLQQLVWDLKSCQKWFEDTKLKYTWAKTTNKTLTADTELIDHY